MMTEVLRITGILQAIPNSVTKDVRFVLSVEDKPNLLCAAQFGVAESIAAAMTDGVRMLSTALKAQDTWVKVGQIQHPESMQIQKDAITGQIILTVLIPQEVERRLSLSPEEAMALSQALEKSAQDHLTIGRA